MIYVNRRHSHARVETIETFVSYKLAIQKIKDLQTENGNAHYYMSNRPSNCWKKKEEVDAA